MVNTSTKPYKWRKYVATLDSRTRCDSTCKYFSFCPLMIPTNDVDCRLKSRPPKDKRHFFNLFIRGRDGIRDEFFDALYYAGTAIDFESDTKATAAYLEMLNKTIRIFYGDTKNKKDEPGEIKFKVRSTIGVNNEPLPMTESDIKEEHDPDSLYSSPIIDEFMKDEDDDD